METSLIVLNENLDTFRGKIELLGEESPEKAYILANALKKMGTDIEAKYKDGFRKYWDSQGELPGGYAVKVSTRKTYSFKDNPEYAQKKAELDALEDKLKLATEMSLKGDHYVDANGEIIDPVSVSYAEVYSVTRK